MDVIYRDEIPFVIWVPLMLVVWGGYIAVRVIERKKEKKAQQRDIGE